MLYFGLSHSSSNLDIDMNATVKDEIKDSAWLALPGLFWVWVVYNFYQYGVEHGFVF